MSNYVDNGNSKSTTSKRSLASSLNPDVVFIIARLAYPNPTIKHIPNYYGDFVSLTRVCRSWRYALLSYATFWTKIEVPLKNTWFLEEVLRRSADYPLDIYISLDRKPEFIARSLEITFSHLHRIRNIIFQKTHHYISDLEYIFRLLDNMPAPLLKVFAFDPLVERPWVKNTVPENIFVDMAPNLEEFSLAYVTISHQMPILKTITRLHLRYVRGITSVHQLFDMLEATSHLEVLELDSLQDLSPTFDVQDLNDRSIQFSTLKTLSLSLEPEILMAVLNHTALPSEIYWSIDCHNALTKPALNIVPLLSFISRTRNGTCLTLRITGRDLQMEFAQNPTDSYDVSLRMELSEADVCLHRLNSVFVNFGLSKVYFCDVIYPSRISDMPLWLDKYQATFNSLFSLFDSLEKLVVAFEDTTGLWQFMSELLPDDGSTVLPCPLLSDLKVGVVSTKGDTLVQILTLRKEAGSVLTNLCVEYDYYDRSILDVKSMLKELVENVEVATLDLTVEDNISFLEVGSGGRMYDRPMHSYTHIPYTKRHSDVERGII